MHDPTSPLGTSIQNGICYVLFAYDTTLSINLDDAKGAFTMLLNETLFAISGAHRAISSISRRHYA
jgi:hypothetical protein